jgi:hypothetical protein
VGSVDDSSPVPQVNIRLPDLPRFEQQQQQQQQHNNSMNASHLDLSFHLDDSNAAHAAGRGLMFSAQRPSARPHSLLQRTE